MPRDYLANVRRFLLAVAEEWWLVELLANAADAAARATLDPEGPEADRALARARRLSDAGPMAWITATPLMRRIDQLLGPPGG